VKRTLPLVLFACLGLAGCSRSADPLDWKIQAGHPAELQNWMAGSIWSKSPALAGELTVCLTNIRTDTSVGPSGKQKDYRFCQRVDGRTVREALIEGHELANRTMRASITSESDAVVRLLGTADTLSPEELRKCEAVMNAHLAAKEMWTQRLKQSEKRIAELSRRPGSN
jgi:hypothetical protein